MISVVVSNENHLYRPDIDIMVSKPLLDGPHSDPGINQNGMISRRKAIAIPVTSARERYESFHKDHPLWD